MAAHGVPSALSTGGSLPDLSSLHFPSPLPTPLDQDEPGFPGSSLSGGSSTGNLASTLTQLGIHAANAPGGNGSFHHHASGTGVDVSPAPNPGAKVSLKSPLVVLLGQVLFCVTGLSLDVMHSFEVLKVPQ